MSCALIQEEVSRSPRLSLRLPLNRMCQLLGVGRDTYYRWAVTDAADDAHSIVAGCDPDSDTNPNSDILVRDAIQRIALEMSSYGYRTMTKELVRQGFKVNHKRVLRLMREDNLLCLRKKRFHVTTDSNHGFPVYPNLAVTLELKELDQLWVADITYIRLRQEFIYLAVILDAFSRRCIGWELQSYLDARLSLAALAMALRTRTISPGLVHHSDRGAQYACGEYTTLLQESGIEISMSRRGNPYDNAKAESFMKTLKYEEVYLNEYDSMTQARKDIGHFLEKVYNQKRLHSSLGYLPPTEFEAALKEQSP